MALFDELIADVGSRFRLGPKAEALLQELVGLIKDHPDGVGGFLNQFKSAGFGDQAASWLGDSKGAALSGLQVEKALGRGVIAAIASKLALGSGTVGDAIGYAMPKLVGLLTPGGVVPKLLPASIADLPSVEPPRLPRHLARPIEVRAARDAGDGNSAGPWAAPFLLLVAVALLTYYFPSLYKEYYPRLYQQLFPAAEAPSAPESAPQPPPAAASASAPSPAPSSTPAAPEPAPAAPVPAPAVPAPALVPAAPAVAPAQLRLDRADGVVTYAGSVGSAASRDEVIASLKAQFGADRIRGDVSVDPSVASPSWLANLKQALMLFKSPSWHAAFDGSSLDVGASNGGDKIVAGLKSLYGSALTISGAAKGASESAAGDEQTATALAGLKPGFTGADLVSILNKYIINFDTGSATISDASKSILRQAAALIKQLPPDTKVHIDGYADATGDPAANVVLSRHRAEAVRGLLIDAGVAPAELRAKGHGAAHSAAGDNRSDRRIEFSVK
jgi:outer membrane protein OmpA-like peptidoglycan-associated protein/uncharacterized protein YidB (DUF937 family)